MKIKFKKIDIGNEEGKPRKKIELTWKMEENTVEIDVRVPIEIFGWRTGNLYPHTIIRHENWHGFAMDQGEE